MTKWTITITTETNLISEVVKVLNFMGKLKFRYTVSCKDMVEPAPAKGREGELVK